MPPTLLTLHILLALAEGDNVPAAIDELIVRDSQSIFMPDASALYKAIHRLELEGLIAKAPLGRRAYRLTAQGRQVLHSESVRYQRVAYLMRLRRL